jgi:DNA-binding CsgD family transcriptional regulator
MPDSEPARIRAEEADLAAAAANAPWLQADALSTLSAIQERRGLTEEAKATGARAVRLATAGGRAGVELRARTLLARIQLESGDLVAAAETSHLGEQRAQQAGLTMAPFGLDLHYLHYLSHVADGRWSHARILTDRFAVRPANVGEARLSAMALFLDVATGSSRVADRRAWLEPYIASDMMTEYIAAGLFAEEAYWSGDLDQAGQLIDDTIRAATNWAGGQLTPQVIRPAAVGLAVLADQARQARAAGHPAEELVAAAEQLAQTARAGAGGKVALGVDARGWLARAEAELQRARDNNDPANWQEVVGTFGPGFVYEVARSRWRLAEALTEAGDREEAQRQWVMAAQVADDLGATRLRAALDDLGRRARLGPGATRPGPLGGLTSRELEVLRLLVTGRSNREIAAELYIANKTVSVHVSNILAKLGAASRTEAAAIAHDNGVLGAS